LRAAPQIDSLALTLKKATLADVWTPRANFPVPTTFTAAGLPFDASIFGPGGTQYAVPMTAPQLDEVRTSRLQYVGTVAGGKQSVRIAARKTGNWTVTVRVRGVVGTIPDFGPETSFQIRLRLGGAAFISGSEDLRGSSNLRRFP